MKKKIFVAFAMLLCASGFAQVPQLLSHQGYIADSVGNGITNTLPMTFRMFNDSTGGSAILTQSFPGVSLTKGVFNVNLDVSSLSFTGQYWLETEVNGQTLSPRARLTSAAYSLAPWATNGSSIYYNGGNVGIGTTSPAAKLDVAGNVKITDGTEGAGKVLTSDANGVASWVTPSVAGADGFTDDGAVVRLTTSTDSVGIRTTTPTATLDVNGSLRAVSLLGQGSSATGSNANALGQNNSASGESSTIGGGENNIATAPFSTVGGGSQDTAGGFASTVSGGFFNAASGSYSTVAGGSSNVASGDHSTVIGGALNTAAGPFSLAGGRGAKANHSGAFVWGDNTDADFTSTGDNQFLIRASGGVGIGTSAPSAKLDVRGTDPDDGGLFQVANSDESHRLTIFSGRQNDPNPFIQWKAGDPLRFSTDLNGWTELMRINPDGNVGIGTLSPASILDVRRPDNSAGDAIAFGTQGYFMGRLGEDASTNMVYLSNTYGPPASNGAGIQFRLASNSGGTSGVPRMTILNNGNVGIGTTAPAYNLDVRSSGTTGYGGQIHLEAPNLVSSGSTVITQGKGTGVVGNQAEWRYDYYGDGNFLNAHSFGFYGVQPFVSFTRGGKVGIGTTSPGTRLHIKQSADALPGDGLTVERQADASQWWIGMDNSNSLLFRARDAAGTFAPGYAFLTPTSFGLITTSDRRAKKDIVPMGACLDRVMQLKPTSFRYKNAAENTPPNYGFIAQEIETVFPDLVLEKDGLKTLVTDCLIAVNTRAIQELKLEKDKQISELQKQVDELKDMVKSLAAEKKGASSKSMGELR